jgi:hypothetical protein
MAADLNAVVAVANPGSISGYRSGNGVGLSSFRACFLRFPVSYGQIVESLIWRAGFQEFGEPDFREFESQVCVGKRRVVSFGLRYDAQGA